MEGNVPIAKEKIFPDGESSHNCALVEQPLCQVIHKIRLFLSVSNSRIISGIYSFDLLPRTLMQRIASAENCY